jgi:ADP-ribose pyrophosphatase YjhB (NUDIX family)
MADFPRPLASVDLVIFSVAGEGLQVLLVQRPEEAGEPFPGQWALPGGFVDVTHDADLRHTALRKLREKTGLRTPFLEQLGSWGSATRDPRGWSATHAYFALVPSDAPLSPGANAADARWFAVDGQRVRQKLAFDHAEILSAALERLRSKVEYTSLPAFLLPREFTLSELQRAYEIVLGRPLEKSAFRTRVLSAGLVEPVDKLREGPNRPARIYRLKQAGPVYFARTFNPRDK